MTVRIRCCKGDIKLDLKKRIQQKNVSACDAAVLYGKVN